MKAAVARILAAHGESMTLKREGAASIAVKAKRLPGSIESIGGSAVQQEFQVRLGTAELAASSWSPAVPVRTDSIVIDDRERSILDVRPLRDGDVVHLYELTVAG
jgi:hypothetical protein